MVDTSEAERSEARRPLVGKPIIVCNVCIAAYFMLIFHCSSSFPYIVCKQAQLGRRHSPGFALPSYLPDRSGSLGASRSDSIPEDAVVGRAESHPGDGQSQNAGPMGCREILLQVPI